MRLYVVQHGEALTKDVDPDRPLSDKGRADTAQLAEWLATRGVRVSEILHSDKARAEETAALLRVLLEPEGRIRQVEGLGPEDSPKRLLGRLRETENDVLIVSHMPFVARLVAVATTGGPNRQVVDFVPGSIAGLERRVTQSWRLTMFVRPQL